jgi:hypothetical protein
MPSPRLPGCLFQDKRDRPSTRALALFHCSRPPESPPTFASGKGGPPRYPENLAGLTKEVPGRAPLASQIAVMLRSSENTPFGPSSSHDTKKMMGFFESLRGI